MRLIGWRGAKFTAAALLAVAVVHLWFPASAMVTLALTTGLVLHGSWALGRGFAIPLVVAFCTVLGLIASPAPMTTQIALTAMTGVAAVLLAGRCDRRTCVLRASLWVGLIGGAVGLATMVLEGTTSESAAIVAAAAAGGPMLGAALAIIVGPILERAFGHATRLTLNEWLSYDHPLLQRLMAVAPGTFQHSVNVGLLAHAAAEAIGADGLLARVGGLYHDVGKMQAPEFFIENQTGANPHDALAPDVSARILRAHVSDGVGLIAAHHMGERIADFVREHHGVGVMRLLEAKAETAPGTDLMPGETFAYPGPRPQSRETGIVMVADQVEATARAALPEDLASCLDVVHRTISRIDQDGQLEASGLATADLAAVERAMARAINAMYHRRLPYPPSVPLTTPVVSLP